MPPRPNPRPQSNTLLQMFSDAGKEKRYLAQIAKYTSNIAGKTMQELQDGVAVYEPSAQMFRDNGFSDADDVYKKKFSLIKESMHAMKHLCYLDVLREYAAECQALSDAIHGALRNIHRQGADLEAFGPGLVFTDRNGNNVWRTGDDKVVHWNNPEVKAAAREEAPDASGVDEEKRKKGNKHLTVPEKLMLIDCAEYFAQKECYRHDTGVPVWERVYERVREVFPRYSGWLQDGQNLRNWYHKREQKGEEGLRRMTGNDGAPSKLNAFRTWIDTTVKESCEYGVPLSKVLLYECLCGAVATVAPGNELFQRIREAMTEAKGLWTPSYTTFCGWLQHLKITLKSSKKTAAAAYPVDWEAKLHDLIMRIALVLAREHPGGVNWDLLCNTDETAGAYAMLSERGVSCASDRPTNMAHVPDWKRS